MRKNVTKSYTAAAIAAAALVGFALPTFADTTVAPAPIASIGFSEEFQQDLEDDYGLREGEYLTERVIRFVTRELEERGVVAAEGGPTIEITVEDAKPNKPTFQQLNDTPGLDYFASVSTGGAALSATIRGPDGAVVDEVSFERFSHFIDDAAPAISPWQDADRSIRWFADRVADAYVEAAQN